MTAIPEDNPTPARSGQQLALIRQPERQPTPRPVWLAAQRIRGERHRQQMSITERDNMRRFYMRVMVDEHPPIA